MTEELLTRLDDMEWEDFEVKEASGDYTHYQQELIPS